jgi:phosphoglycerol transferase MdoB-like AlkP superfamily enzyme
MELRSHIFQEKILDPIRLYASFLVSLFFVMVVVRGLEIFTVFTFHQLDFQKILFSLNGILNDAVFTLILGAVFYPMFWMLFLILRPMSEFYARSILLLILFVYLAIDKYFLESLTPLAADFWGYSYEDLATTVRSSASFSLLDVLAFLLLPILILFIYNKLLKIYIPHIIYPIAMVCITVGACLFPSSVTKELNDFDTEADYFLTANKAKYFMDKSLVYFQEKEDLEQEVGMAFDGDSYPLLKDFDEKDELSPYFDLGTKPPNLVFVLIESLGRSFTGPGAQNGGFTPYIDSLSAEALYWENCIAPTGRTFGILPNVFGSLPFAADGFNALGNTMPQHISLLSEAKKLGYSTHYFYGGNVGFDNQRDFLERQNLDYILGEGKFPSRFQKMKANSGGFSWGYADKDVFELAHETVNKAGNKPRIDVYMTLVNHEPFVVPEEKYHQKFTDRLNELGARGNATFNQYQNIFECLLYTDDAVRELMDRYKKREDFENTIFIFTGDHRMIPIEHRNALDRFHVPLIIWSPMLKQPKAMKAMVSHSQIAPSFFGLFKNKYDLDMPQKTAFINSGLSFNENFETKLTQPIMKNKGDLNLIIKNNYFLDNGLLYKILPELEIDKTGFRIRENELQKLLDDFKLINKHVTQNNKLYKNTLGKLKRASEFTFNSAQLNIIAKFNADNIGSDSLLSIAQKLFKSDRYSDAKTILQYTLNRSPTYADVRILLGRIHYWEDNEILAKQELSKALKYSPQYDEAYRALTTVLVKTKDYQRLNTAIDSALDVSPADPEYLYFKALAYAQANDKKSTLALVDSLLLLDTLNQDLINLKDSL